MACFCPWYFINPTHEQKLHHELFSFSYMYKKQKSKIERINELISLESCKYTHDNIGSMIIKKQLYNEKLIPIISG